MATDGNRKLRCNDCGQTFTRGSALSSHIKYKHQGFTFKGTDCKWDCGTSSHTTSVLKRHEEICWLNPKNTAHCECCGVLIERVVSSKRTNDDRKYCGSSCSAKVANHNREVTWGDKISKTMNEYYDNHEYFRDYDRIKEFKQYRKFVDRLSRVNLKTYNRPEYDRLMSNKWTGSGDTSRLCIDHIEQVYTCWCKRKSVEEASDISNLRVITMKENLERQVGYNPKLIFEKYSLTK